MLRQAVIISAVVATLGGCAINSWETDYILLPEGEVHVVAAPEGVSFLPPDHRLRYFPPRARERVISGRGTVRCRVGADGKAEGCVGIAEHPADPYFSFADATRRIALRSKADPGIIPPGTTFEVTMTFLAHVWIDLDCDVTVERIATDCRVRQQHLGDPSVGERVARAAEGKPPPEGVDAFRPGRARWRVIDVAPVGG